MASTSSWSKRRPCSSAGRPIRRGWIPITAAQRAAELTDSRQAALDYLAYHVSNRLDRARAEAFLDNAPAMLDCFVREGFAVFSPVPTWADYYPDEPGALRGGRSLGPETFDGRGLGSFFPSCARRSRP